MKAAYMPFTYLSEATARLLYALVGPLVIYQPLKTQILQNLSALASEGLVEIRTPMTRDDDRLRAALTEFTEWARLNPGRSTPGPGFIGSQQGQVPFYDENAVNRIRSDIRRYQASGPQAGESEDGFSARMFLALAQDNDLNVDRLDNDLDRFKDLEKGFLEALEDAGDAGFSRQAYGSRLWREDPGAKLTGQRIRAWASLAIADGQLPKVLITTSPAVVEVLLDDNSSIEKLTDIRLRVPSDGSTPVLGEVLDRLSNGANRPSADLSAFALPAMDATSEAGITATFYVAANMSSATVIRRLGRSTTLSVQSSDQPESAGHTLIVMIDG